nr:Chain C, NP-N5H peptide [synthetic construct]
ASNEHMETM